MTYILDLGLWHVGPFPTHVAAQHWAESHGCDDYRMIPLDDPAEAPARIHRLKIAAADSERWGATARNTAAPTTSETRNG
jgi:hypothetical protein